LWDAPNMAFELYKPGQGVYARATTGIGGGIIAVFGGYWFNGALIGLPPVAEGAELLGIPITYGLIGALIAFGVLGGVTALLVIGVGIGLKKVDRFSRASVDFLIETEAELRKVSWPSRDELTGSTFVVLFVTVMLGLFIVVVDKFVSAVMTHLAVL